MDIIRKTGGLLIPVFCIVFLACPFLAAAQGSGEPVAPDEGMAGSAPADFSGESEGVLADEVPSWEDAFAGRDENLPSTSIWNIIFALGMVIIVFWAIFRFVVRPLMRGAVFSRGVEGFRIVASLPIAPTKSVQVVKMVDRLLVIGIAEGGMSLLTEVTDAREVSEMLKALDEKNPAKYHPFKKAFDTMLARKDEAGFEDKQKKFNTTLDGLREKIHEMKSTSDDDE